MQQKKIICKVLELIDNNSSEKLTLQKLADLSGYSPVQLTRLFTEFAGITPMRYVNASVMFTQISLQ